MGFQKTVLDAQLAEVAAGRRACVDYGTQQLAVAEKAREDQEAARLQAQAIEENTNRLIAVAKEQTEAQAKFARVQARAAEDQASASRIAADVARESLVQQIQYQKNIEAREQERNELIAEANREENERLAQEADAAKNHRRALLQLEKKRDKTSEQSADQRRMQDSPSYLAASWLLKLKNLETPLGERAELEILLKPVESLLKRCRAAIGNADVEFQRKGDVIDSAYRENLEHLINQSETELLVLKESEFKLLEKISVTENQLYLSRRTINPRTWVGVTASTRYQLEVELVRLRHEKVIIRESLSACKTEINKLEASLDLKPQKPPRLPKHEEIASIAAKFKNELQVIENNISTWYSTTPRTRALSRLLELPEQRKDTEVVDYETCMVLDNLRSNGETDVSYGNLGRLPAVTDLSKILAKVSLLNSQMPPFELTKCSVPGWQSYQSLKLLMHGYDVSEESGNTLLSAAKEFISSRDHFYVSDLEENFGISLEKALMLVHWLDSFGLITLDDEGNTALDYLGTDDDDEQYHSYTQYVVIHKNSVEDFRKDRIKQIKKKGLMALYEVEALE